MHMRDNAHDANVAYTQHITSTYTRTRDVDTCDTHMQTREQIRDALRDAQMHMRNVTHMWRTHNERDMYMC